MACRPSSPESESPGGASARARVLVRGRDGASSAIETREKLNTGARADLFLDRPAAGPSLPRDPRTGFYGRGDEGVSADHRPAPDHGLTAQNRRIRVNHHVTLDRGMAAKAGLGPR